MEDSLELIPYLPNMIQIYQIIMDLWHPAKAWTISIPSQRDTLGMWYKMIANRQAFAFTADAVKTGRKSRQKSHCEAIFDGFLPITMKELNSYGIVSLGVNPTLAQEFATDIMDIVKGKATINDFMLIDTENTSAEITPVEGANLANPAVIKAQVVEFMKYRAPIDLLTSTDGKKGLYSKLTEVQKNIEVMPAEMEIQNKKMAYYDAENKLMEKALEIYVLLKSYEAFKPSETQELNRDYLETTVKTDMGAVDATKGLIADYKELHRKYVSNWANTKDYTEGIKSVQTRVSAASLGASGGSVSKNDVINGIKNCTKAREAMATALANLNTKLDEITFEDLPEEQINQNQYWVQLHKAIGSEYDTYINKLTAFLKAKNQMAYNYEKGKMQPYTVKEKRTRTVTKTETNKETGLPEKVTCEEEYEVEVTKYRDITGDDFGGGQTIAGAYESESGNSDAADDYQNERIYEISNRMQTYSDAAFQDENDNNVKRANADAEIAENFAGLLPVKDGVTGNNPQLHNDTPTKDKQNTALDAWFHKQFPDDLKTLAEAKGILSNLKNMLNQLENYAIEGFGEYKNEYQEDIQIEQKEDLPSDGVSPNSDAVFNQTKDTSEDALQKRLESTSNSAGGLFDDIDFATLATNGRDNLYATMYIMNMFSYETSALEGLYELQGDGKDENDIYKMSDGNKIKPGNADTYYDDLLNKAPSTTEGDWWNTKKSFQPNKTLTNKMLDMDHCISYGNEIEYILYGDTNEKNALKIESTMMFTRFALNFAPVLAVYWGEDYVKSIATTISGLTQGIIPAPLVKLIICLGVCAAESAVDMSYLKAGLPVAFYKKAEGNQLFIELDLDLVNLEKAIKDGTTSYAKNMMTSTERSIKKDTAAFSYSDYVSLYLFIALGLNENDIYKRTADVIQLNMRENYPELGEYKLKDAHTYFRIDANIRVKPLMLELPYAKMCGIEAPEDGAWNTLHSGAVRGY